MSASESTPLLTDVRIEEDHLPFKGPLTWLTGLASFLRTVPPLVIRGHYIGLILALISAVVCWRSGNAGKARVDPLVIKSVLLLFSLTLGFRNSIANQKRALAMDKVHRLTGAFWGIYTMLRDDVRKEFKLPLLEALGSIVDQLFIASNRNSLWHGTMGLRPQCASNMTSVTLSPRSLMCNTLLALEAKLVDIEGRPAGTLVRNLWLHKLQLLESYDVLFACTIPPVGTSYYIFSDLTLATFAAALPWSLKDGAFASVVSNTLLLGLGVFSFEAVTRAYEDTLAPGFAHESLALENLRSVSAAAVAGFDLRLAEAESHSNLLKETDDCGRITLERLACLSLASGGSASQEIINDADKVDVSKS